MFAMNVDRPNLFVTGPAIGIQHMAFVPSGCRRHSRKVWFSLSLMRDDV
jgi:hypothetical protein